MNKFIKLFAFIFEQSSYSYSDLVSDYRVCTGLKNYWNLEGFLEKSLKIKSALKSTGKSLKSLEKSLNSTIFCRT